MFHLDIRIIYIISTSLNVLCTETYDDLRNGSDDDLFPCLENSDCERVNGTCENLFCKCNNSYNCKAAIPILVNKLGESCETIKECNIEYSVCDENKKCSCINEYIHSSNERKCLKNLGKPCQLFGECSLVTNAGCVNSNCQCDNNYISNGTVCLLKANGLNFRCSDEIQCRAQLGYGSECFRGSCRCREVYHFKASSNKCVQDILLNEVCSKHSDCHQPGAGPSRMECVVGVCKCKSPYLEESGICLSSSTSVVFFKSVMLFLGTIFLIK